MDESNNSSHHKSTSLKISATDVVENSTSGVAVVAYADFPYVVGVANPETGRLSMPFEQQSSSLPNPVYYDRGSDVQHVESGSRIYTWPS